MNTSTSTTFTPNPDLPEYEKCASDAFRELSLALDGLVTAGIPKLTAAQNQLVYEIVWALQGGAPTFDLEALDALLAPLTSDDREVTPEVHAALEDLTLQTMAFHTALDFLAEAERGGDPLDREYPRELVKTVAAMHLGILTGPLENP